MKKLEQKTREWDNFTSRYDLHIPVLEVEKTFKRTNLDIYSFFFS